MLGRLFMKRLVVTLCGVVSLGLTVVAWTTVRDRPLSREYIEVMERTRNLSPEDQARQLTGIRKFDDRGGWREPELYVKLIGPFATIGFFAMAFRSRPNPQGGGNGRQPFGSEGNQGSAAAASRRSP